MVIHNNLMKVWEEKIISSIVIGSEKVLLYFLMLIIGAIKAKKISFIYF